MPEPPRGASSSISRATPPADEAVHAAELLGRYVRTQSDDDREAFESVVQDWPAEVFRSWLARLQTDVVLRCAQNSGYQWAPGGAAWQAGQRLRDRLDAKIALDDRCSEPKDRHRGWLRRCARDLVEDGAGFDAILARLDELNAEAPSRDRLSRIEVWHLARRATHDAA